MICKSLFLMIFIVAVVQINYWMIYGYCFWSSVDKGNLGVPQLPGQGCSIHSFRTNTYKLSFMESPSGIKVSNIFKLILMYLFCYRTNASSTELWLCLKLNVQICEATLIFIWILSVKTINFIWFLWRGHMEVYLETIRFLENINWGI